jgi:hypothetical protein
MGRGIIHIAWAAIAALVLTGCGFADSRAPVPEFMRLKQAEPPPLEAPPDVKGLVRQHLDSVFVAASAPHDVQVSTPRPDLRGPGWTACVRAELTAATGKPLGQQTYDITIKDGVILDRRRVDEADDPCLTERYEPI